jgi:hypothetical protein
MKPKKKFTFSNHVMFVDGMPGCGKTLFSPFLGAYPQVELLTYAYEVERYCGLYYLNEIGLDAASTLINLSIDQITYHSMMCRETNFRPSDLSSVFKNPNKMRYFKRLFMKGDHAVTQRIKDEKPILNLTTHGLLAHSEPIFFALGDRATFVEIIRHPLYQIRQHYLNTKNLYIQDPRHLELTYQTGREVVPFFVKEYENEWINGNPMDKAILSMYYWGKQVDQLLSKNKTIKSQTIVIPFERFVLCPDSYLKSIESTLGVDRTNSVLKALKRQNVPRKRIADGISLPVYKRCGWTPPIDGTEKDELLVRSDEVRKKSTIKVFHLLQEMNEKYEEKHMKGIL